MELDIKRLDTVIANQPDTRLIALLDDQFVGCVDLRCAGRSACIKELFVRPDVRGNHIAKTLVEQCVDIATEKGCETIAASIEAVNRDVVGFYETLGWIVGFDFGEDNSLAMILPLNRTLSKYEVKVSK